MKWVRVLVGCMVDGKAIKPGTLVEVSDSDYWTLIQMARAVPEDPKPEPVTATAPPAKKAVRRTATKGRRKKTA